MNIIIFLKEQQYERVLARGMAFYSGGMNIIALHENERKITNILNSPESVTKKSDDIQTVYNEISHTDFDVMITDDIPAAGIYPEKTLFISDNNRDADYSIETACHVLNITSCLSEIIRTSIHIFENNTGRRFLLSGFSKKKIIKFYSPFGGAGATSIAITCARLLKIRLSREVLIICNSYHENYRPYINIVREKLRPGSELEYLLETGRKVDSMDYADEDEFGIFYINIEKNIAGLLREIEDGTDFDYILIDTKDDKCLDDFDGYVDIAVKSNKDKREYIQGSNKIIQINNFADSNNIINESDKIYCDIIYDEDSFRVQGEKITIRMNSAFAAGVMDLMQIVSDGESME